VNATTTGITAVSATLPSAAYAPNFTVLIRELAPDHAAAFQELRLHGLRESPSAFAGSYEDECDIPIATIAERLTARPDRCVLGAFDEHRLIGLLGLKQEGARKLAHKAFLWGMFVNPAVRRSGTGRKLVAEALARAAAMPGVRQVNLGVNASNVAAIGLYAAMGFVAYGLERGFLLLDGQLHDEILMVRALSTDRELRSERTVPHGAI
jgi:ribosomal protein S18 acetylase RimI-like enzyme